MSRETPTTEVEIEAKKYRSDPTRYQINIKVVMEGHTLLQAHFYSKVVPQVVVVEEKIVEGK